MKLPKALPLLVATLVMSSTVSAQVPALSGTLSATKNVTVNATLNSACVFTTSTAVVLNATYPAFTLNAVEATSDAVDVQCTRGGNIPSVNFGDTAIGVVSGLVFQLTTVWTDGVAGGAPLGGDISDLGSPRTASFVVKASFPGNQAGATGVATQVTKQMTLNF